MNARLETFARAVTWLNSRTTPSGMHRLNRYLVLHRPVLWRSRLIWVAWWSILLSFALGGIGCWIARSTSSVWATEDLQRLLHLVQYASVVLTIVWAVIHLRIPLGELSWGSHAGAAVANFSVILLTFLPSHALGVSAGYTGAHLLQVADVVAALECVEVLEPVESVANLAHQSTGPFQRLKVRQGAPVKGRACDQLSAWDTFEPSSEPQDIDAVTWLRSRIKSIADSQSFWHKGEGALYEDCVQPWRLELLAAFCGALLLGALGYPASAWRRRFGISIHVRGWRTASLPRVRWLEQLNRHLVTTSPLIWAARVHYLLPLVASLVLGAAALNLVGRFWFRSPDWDITKVAVGLVAGLWPLAWQLARRTDIGQALPERWQAVTATSLAAALCVPLAMFPAGAFVKENPGLLFGASAAGIAYGVWTAGYVLVRAYKTRFQTFLVEAVALCLALSLAVMSVQSELWGAGVSGAFAAVGFVLWQTERASRSAARARRRSLGAALCLLTFPALLVSMVRAVVVPAGHGLPSSDVILVGYAVVACALVIAAAYLLALGPFVRALALAERAPKSD